MNRLLIVLLIGAVLLSGCVGQPTTQTTTTTTTTSTTPSQVQESQEFSHDLDQGINDLDQLG